LARDDMAEAVEDAFRYDRLVLASITYQGEIFPFMSTFIHTLAEHAYQNRTVALVEAGSWAPTAAKVMTKELEGMKDITLAQNKVTVLGSLNDTSRAQIEALADELSK
ncbi:MAG: FprA family A-type flavoprotein, partial [Collinsella sp.]|nr:FprA family A-type flavoprotein [Collinsella sp.]